MGERKKEKKWWKGRREFPKEEFSGSR